MAQSPLVSFHQVSKSYATVHAVDNISFQVGRGEIFALLGPNGAGKSTVVRMLIGMLRPDHGSVVWHDAQGHPVLVDRSLIGYLPEDRGLYKSEPVGRILSYFGQLRGMSTAESRSATAWWLERLGLEGHAKTKLDALSKGNQQKVQIAAALVHSPTLAVLDEPFSGLDPLNQELLVELINELQANGTTILLSAHQLNLVERLADHVLLMDHGREVLSGTVPQIKQSAYGGRVLEMEFSRQVDLSQLDDLETHADVLEIQARQGHRLRILLRGTASIPDWIQQLSQLGPLENLNSSPLSLHDIYLRALASRTARSVSQTKQPEGAFA